jgi:hypothetical protein
VLIYIHTGSGIRHSIGWNLIAGVDITGTSFLRTEAHRLGDLLADCMATVSRITDWEIQDANGSPFYTEAYGAGGVGNHVINSNMQPWYSTTVAMEGVATPPAPGVCHGHVICRLHTYGALDFPPGMQFFDSSIDAAYATFIDAGLNASTYVPADKYGQQANIQALMPVQWNAATQGSEGS